MEQARLPRRDRVTIYAALAGVTALSWVYLIRMAADMDMPMDMSSMSQAGLQIKPWMPADFIYMFLMWAVMMVGMMVPTAIPMTLIYAAIARKAGAQGTPLAPSGIFVSGYIAMWTIFSTGATVAQWGLDQAVLLSPMMVSNSPALGACLLIAAGLYQMTPAKNACLRHCRSPAHFISEHWRRGPGGAFLIGLEHGAFCMGCCWALMGLLFFGGVMNLLWIAGITLFVLLEKVMPFGGQGGRIAGGAMIICGLVVLSQV